jgi:aryl-alcohol dehydrogenase-like predicted oxidoreductase
MCGIDLPSGRLADRARLHADELRVRDAASDDDPKRVIGRALDLGVTMFDTADVYGPFTNDELLGRALDGRRAEATIATKVGLVVGPNGGYPLSRDARPERIAEEVRGSLRRLRTDVIDLYYLHRVDGDVPSRTRGARWPRSSKLGSCERSGSQRSASPTSSEPMPSIRSPPCSPS